MTFPDNQFTDKTQRETMAQPGRATDCHVESEITAVTLYESSAQVHREATVSIGAGLTRVLFDGLPAGLDESSMQVGLAGEGTDAIVLRGITFELVETANETFEQESAEVQTAAADAERLKKELLAAKDAVEVGNEAGAFMECCFTKSTTPCGREPADVADVAKWAGIVGAAAASFEGQQADRRALEARVKTVTDDLAAAKATLGRPLLRTKTTRLVCVLLESGADVLKAGLLLSYVVGDASWRPEYEVRVDSSTGAVKLGYNAVLVQGTSELWRDVALTLSTARPSLSGRQPEMDPWRIRIYKPKPIVTKHKSRLVLSVNAKCMPPPAPPCPSPCVAMCVEEAEVSEGATAVSFDIKGTHVVTNDREPTRVPIASLDLQSEVTYAAVPKMVEAAYAVAEVTNTSAFVLVAGTSNVFLDGQFVATSSMERVPPGDTFKVNVGRDEGVTVKYKLLNKKREDAGGLLSGKQNLVAFRYRTTIRNGKPIPITVKVSQSIPVGDSDRIVVALVEPTLTTKTQELQRAEEGLIETTHTVAAGETLEIPLSFDVTYPHKATLYGV